MIKVGLIRKSLYLGTGGVVSPSSKKQRYAKQTLAAIQGGTPEQIRRAGGRYDFDGFLGGSSVAPPGPRFGPSAGKPDPDFDPRANFRAEHVPDSNEYRAAHQEPARCPECQRVLTAPHKRKCSQRA